MMVRQRQRIAAVEAMLVGWLLSGRRQATRECVDFILGMWGKGIVLRPTMGFRRLAKPQSVLCRKDLGCGEAYQVWEMNNLMSPPPLLFS